MFVGANWNGKSKPSFNVVKEKKKNGNGVNYRTTRINADKSIERLHSVVFPFM